MALIPDDPKQKQALAVIAVSLVVLYFANNLWYSGAMEAVEAEEARVENMQAQNRTAQALAIRAGQDTEERMALYERHIAQLEQLIPEEAEVAALVDQISLAGREVGVTVATLRTNPPEAGEFYTVQTFERSMYLVQTASQGLTTRYLVVVHRAPASPPLAFSSSAPASTLPQKARRS